jgi:FkbM family methyltransferase
MQIIKKILNKFKLAFEISSLGANLSSKLSLFFYILWISIKKRTWSDGKIGKKFKLKKFNKIFYFYLTDNSDLTILKEIFVDNEYDFDLPYSPEIIFDLGSNVGLSVIYFRLKYPNAKIYAFEPDPETFKKLRKNIKQFNDIFIFNLAISDKNGKEKFYIYPNQSMSSSLLQRLPNQPFIEVETKTLDSIFAELSIDKVDLLKFDIEGVEYDVFKNFKNLDKINNIIGEVHLDLIKTSKEEFLDIFNGFSIDLKQISSKRYLIKASKND